MPDAPACIDLKAAFGERFRIAYEESFYAEHKTTRSHDPWLCILPCPQGHIFPWGGTTLAASTNNRRGSNALRRLPCVTIEQDEGQGGGVTALFDLADFEAVAAVMRPRKRVRLSAERRARMSEIGTAALKRYRLATQNGTKSNTGSVPTTQPDPEATPAA